MRFTVPDDRVYIATYLPPIPSSCVWYNSGKHAALVWGFCIGLIDAFFRDGGVNQVDDNILLTIISRAAEGIIFDNILLTIISRAAEGIILLWFAQQVTEFITGWCS